MDTFRPPGDGNCPFSAGKGLPLVVKKGQFVGPIERIYHQIGNLVEYAGGGCARTGIRNPAIGPRGYLSTRAGVCGNLCDR